MHPVRAQVINEIDGGADRPGEGIRPVDVADLADEVDDEHDVVIFIGFLWIIYLYYFIKLYHYNASLIHLSSRSHLVYFVSL